MAVLAENDYPAIFGDANDSSLRGQSRFLITLRVRLLCLTIAAVGGAVVWSLGNVEVGGLVALVAFVTALAAETYSLVVRPEREWYEGRAAAESVKTLTWRYIVRGERFDDAGGVEGDQKFIASIRDILKDLDEVHISVNIDRTTQITPKMRQLRNEDFTTRRKNYLNGRIEDQRNWYAAKAVANEKRSHAWRLAIIIFEFLGIIGAALKAFSGATFDWLGILAAVAAGITGWAQAKQHENLATAYSLTSHELGSIAAEFELVTEESDWASFVGQSEEAISREHTLWRASRRLRAGR